MQPFSWEVVVILQSAVTVGRLPEKADIVIPVGTGTRNSQ